MRIRFVVLLLLGFGGCGAPSVAHPRAAAEPRLPTCDAETLANAEAKQWLEDGGFFRYLAIDRRVPPVSCRFALPTETSVLDVQFSDGSMIRYETTNCCVKQTMILSAPIGEREAGAILVDAWARGSVRAELGDERDPEREEELFAARRAKPPALVTAQSDAGVARGFGLPNWTLAYLTGSGRVTQLRSRAADGDIEFGW